MNVERLELLQQMLLEVGNGTWYGGEKFAYNQFLYAMFKLKVPVKSKVTYNLMYWVSKRKGGHYACAIGHAMLDKRFQAQGLKPSSGSLIVPEFEGLTGFHAACAFFDLNLDTTHLLFSPFSYVGECLKDPLTVNMRLDWLLHNAHCDEEKFKADIETYGKELI